MGLIPSAPVDAATEKADVQEGLKREKEKGALFTIALDGEGYTDKSGRHRYTYLAAASARHFYGAVENVEGLTTDEVFEFLLSLPEEPVKVGFSLGYDKTKWFETLPDPTVYLLNHPELRPGDHGPRPVRWKKYKIQSLSTRFALHAPVRVPRYGRWRTLKKKCVVWDLFKFYGKAFVPALADWNIGTQEERDAIQAGKDRRGNFESISEAEKLYCQTEVRLMAMMADTLLAAHEEANIPLKQYYGPGSTASVMLNRMGGKEQIAQIPAEMAWAAECAFFGGRFETSLCGPVPNVFGYDIASAYPYIMTDLPCLAHGEWRLVRAGRDRHLQRLIESAAAACVHYSLPAHDGIARVPFDADLVKQQVRVKGGATKAPWGPFPFRLSDGNILYPVVSEGGWVWREEFLAGQRHWPNVVAKEAWILEQDCACGKPFAAGISEYYNLRLEWGKEGKGLVVKLGVNSCYGKRAQRIGAAPFRCTTSAGLITSGTRAMLLDALSTAKDPWNILSVATDGIQSLEALTLASPRTTGTEEKARQKGKSPLGCWESKSASPQHLIRPGMRFCTHLRAPVKDAEKIAAKLREKEPGLGGAGLDEKVALEFEAKMRGETAARGLGVKDLYRNRKMVMESWSTDPMKDVFIQQPNQFMGSKGSVRISNDAKRIWGELEAGLFEGTYAEGVALFEAGVSRDAKYGLWMDPDPRKVSYSPLPKRPVYFADEGYRMGTWALHPEEGESRAYKNAPKSELAQQAEEMKLIESEQPDQDAFDVFEGD